MTYQTNETDAHLQDEENQWANILSSGDDKAGMILVFIQKLCTAFHELEPAYKAGALKEKSFSFLQDRMLHRIDKVLNAMQLNGLEHMDGFEDLAEIRKQAAETENLEFLASLTGPIHQVNHKLCNSLEKVAE